MHLYIEIAMSFSFDFDYLLMPRNWTNRKYAFWQNASNKSHMDILAEATSRVVNVIDHIQFHFYVDAMLSVGGDKSIFFQTFFWRFFLLVHAFYKLLPDIGLNRKSLIL